MTETNTTSTNQISDEVLRPDESAWSVRILKVEEGSLFGAFCVEAPHRFRYIAVTLEYVYQGDGQTELYLDTVALVHIGSSPLQGLSQSPLLFFNEETGEVHRLNEDLAVIPIEAGLPQCSTFVYEFHHDCREFCLYFAGCEGIRIMLPHPPATPPSPDNLFAKQFPGEGVGGEVT